MVNVTSRDINQVHLPSKNDGTSSLDIIVEALLHLIPLQVLESFLGLEILELDQHVGVHFLHSRHELIHKFKGNLRRDSLLSQTQIQGIAKIMLIRGTAIQDNRKCLLGVDTSCASVQGKFADLQTVSGDPHEAAVSPAHDLQKFQHRLHPDHPTQEFSTRQ
jgi:hypothetical protein